MKKLLRLLNPKNLAKEVHMYGYDFSWQMHLLLIICSLLGVGSIGLIFHLKKTFMTITVVTVTVILPLIIINVYKRMFEQKRFADAATYIQQMLYSYQKSNKILASLVETRELFDGGMMLDVIEQAIEYFKAGKSQTEKGVATEALEIIEKQYECVKIHTMHQLLLSCENYGGDYNDSLNILLADTDNWKKRGYRLQQEKKKSHIDNIISISVATVLCAVALYVLDAMQKTFPSNDFKESVFSVPIIQLSSLLFILAMLFVLVKSFKKLTSNWLQGEKLHSDEFVLGSYKTVLNYNKNKERKKSLVYATPFLIGMLVAFVYEKVLIGAILGGVSVFMLMQHNIGYSLAKKDVNNELHMALPQWLMEIALLLQMNNVQVSIQKSIGGAAEVLKPELEKLVERLRKEPSKLSSYTDFCKDFDIPEATSSMKMLHARSEAGIGDATVQIRNLIQQVNELQDYADDIRSKEIVFQTKMIFSYPVVAATLKLLIDMSFGMILMFSMLGSMY